MFQYLLAYLLINSCYRTLGNPVPKHQLVSFPLTILAKQCENPFLSNAISNKSEECTSFSPRNVKKQILCFIFYDINKQLCAAVAASRLSLTQDFTDKINAEQNIDTICTLARSWSFTNLPGYEINKNHSEFLLKSPANCGEICGAEETVNVANEYCKYYEWGIQMLRMQVSTTSTFSSNNNNKIAVDAPVIAEPDVSVKVDKMSVDVPELSNTKALDVQIKQTESAIPKSTPEKTEDSGDLAVPKFIPPLTSTKQSGIQENVPADTKKGEVILQQPVVPNVNTNEQDNKATVIKETKQPGEESDPGLIPESGKDVLSIDKDTDLDKGDSKDDPEYTGNEGDDQEGDDQDFEKNLEKNQEPLMNDKPIALHNSDNSQKVSEIFPNTMTDAFVEDGDNFFPFFLTAVILVVVVYVLYHNKSKVSKVFFGLILEGRQGGRRRNSRGHAYRRLDTLEQAMSGNAAAPPSKIIY